MEALSTFGEGEASMHNYVVSPDNRWRAQLCVTLASLASAWVLRAALDALALTAPWWVDIPSFVGFYGLWWGLHDRFGWHWRWAGLVGLVSVDLSGEWEGTLVSSRDHFGAETSVLVRIRQTSTRMAMLLSTDKSDSNSVGAILEANGATVLLRYLFESRPRAGSPDTMHVHFGAGFLELQEDRLVGDYFTGRDRTTYGRLHLRRKKSPGTKQTPKAEN